MRCTQLFFQAEDGIRKLVRFRGLGDLYKRQGHVFDALEECKFYQVEHGVALNTIAEYERVHSQPVSYTPLTPPTNLRVSISVAELTVPKYILQASRRVAMFV